MSCTHLKCLCTFQPCALKSKGIGWCFGGGFSSQFPTQPELKCCDLTNKRHVSHKVRGVSADDGFLFENQHVDEGRRGSLTQAAGGRPFALTQKPTPKRGNEEQPVMLSLSLLPTPGTKTRHKTHAHTSATQTHTIRGTFKANGPRQQ